MCVGGGGGEAEVSGDCLSHLYRGGDTWGLTQELQLEDFQEGLLSNTRDLIS